MHSQNTSTRARRSAPSLQKPQALIEALNAELTTCIPIPPPLKLAIQPRQSFAVDLTSMTLQVPPDWHTYKHLGGILRHELKHASRDGEPYTYKRYFDHTAALMRDLKISKARAQELLNIIYDVCVDQLVNEKHSIKKLQEYWLKRFPLTAKTEGSEYHLLNIIYKDLFGVELKETEYEKNLRANHCAVFTRLKNTLLTLNRLKKEGYDEFIRQRLIIVAAALIEMLVDKKEDQRQDQKQDKQGQNQQNQESQGQGQGQGQNQDQNQDQNQEQEQNDQKQPQSQNQQSHNDDRVKGTDGDDGEEDEEGGKAEGDKGEDKSENEDNGEGGGGGGGEEEGEEGGEGTDGEEDSDGDEGGGIEYGGGDVPPVRQIICDARGKEGEILEIALNNSLTTEQIADLLDCSTQKVKELYEECARKALWQAVAAYRGRGATYAIEEPYQKKWKPWDRTIDPDSIARHPHEPDKWKATELQPTIQTSIQGGEAGAEIIAVAIDRSSSMRVPFADRSRLAWAKDAALGLIAFAKEHGLPVEIFCFDEETIRLSQRSTNYVEHAEKVLTLTPGTSTHPESLTKALQRCDEGTLVVIITDGCFSENSLRAVTNRVKRSKVICAVVDTDPHSCVNAVTEPNLEIYNVKPSAAGSTLVEKAEKSMMLSG